MTLKRASAFFHLGQQELQEWKGGEAQEVTELVCEAQTIIKALLLKGFEINEIRKPKQLIFRRWIKSESDKVKRKKIYRAGSIQNRSRIISKAKKENRERIY